MLSIGVGENLKVRESAATTGLFVSSEPTRTKIMETTNALVAAALAGVFAAGSTVSQASPLPAGQVPAESERYEFLSKDNNLHQCKGTIEAAVMNGKHMDVHLPNDKGMGKGKKKDKDEEDEGD